MEPQPIDPNKPLAVTHTAQDWQTLIALANAGFARMVESTLLQLNQQALRSHAVPDEIATTADSPPPPTPALSPEPADVQSQRRRQGHR